MATIRAKDLPGSITLFGNSDYLAADENASGETRKVNSESIRAGMAEATTSVKGLLSAGDKTIINGITPHHDAADSYKIKTTGIKDDAVTSAHILDGTIAKTNLSASVKGTFARRNFSIRTSVKPTWDKTTRTLTWTANIELVSAVHPMSFVLAPGSVTMANGDALYLSLTNGSYTPLDLDASTNPITVYAYNSALAWVNKADDGLVLLGQVINAPASAFYFFYTEWDALRYDRWEDREPKNLSITRQGGILWNTTTFTLTITNVVQIVVRLDEGRTCVLLIGSDSAETEIVVIRGNSLVITGDVSGATFTPVSFAQGTRQVGLIAVGYASNDIRDKNTILLGSCYWAYHMSPAGQGQFYARFPTLIPDNYYQFLDPTGDGSSFVDSPDLVGINANSIGGFIHKLKSKTVDANNLLTLVTWGDSIFGRLYRAEMTEAPSSEYAPPAMYRQNIAKTILDDIQFADSDLSYLPIKDMSGFITQDVSAIDPPSPAPPDNSEWTFSGTWVEYMNYDCTYYKKTITQNSYAQVSVTGCTLMALLAIRRSDADTALNITVSVNGGGFVTPSSLGIGVNTINLQKNEASYIHNEQRFYRTIFSDLVSGNTYAFRFTKGTNDASQVILWGVEKWSTNSVRLINTARGGHTSVGLLNYLYDDVITTNYFPDAVIFELPVLNNSAGGDTDANYASNILWTNILLEKLKKSNIETLLLIPHPSSSESAWYIKYIAQARLLACKYGFGIIDMYAKWKDNSLDGRADGTHLNDDGVEYYSSEILKVINCTGTVGASINRGTYIQHGENVAVGSVVFETPYLSTPKIKITAVYYNSTVPSGLYISAKSATGFTVAGTGYFDWEACE